jgi:hypothetical protein
VLIQVPEAHLASHQACTRPESANQHAVGPDQLLPLGWQEIQHQPAEIPADAGDGAQSSHAELGEDLVLEVRA